MSFEDCHEERVLRVDQLDTTNYDQEILAIIKAEISKCFKYFQPGILAQIDPELKAILSLIIWKFSLYSNDATLAQEMLEIKFKTIKTHDGTISKKQKIIHGFLMIFGEWLANRSFEIKQYLNGFGNIEKLWKIVNFGVMFYRFLGLINFLVFLRDARYRSLLERALGIYSVFSKKQSPRQVYFEYMNREILHNGFAEFLFFVLPLINIPRLRNLLLRVMWKKPDALHDGKVLMGRQCGICSELPTNVHQTRCGHVFCYICIKANSMADPSFLCPVCGELVSDDVEPTRV